MRNLKFPERSSSSGRARVRQAIEVMEGVCRQCEGRVPAFALDPVRKTAEELGAILRHGLKEGAVTRRGKIVVIHADRKRTFGKRYTLESDPDGSRVSIAVAALDRLHDLFIDAGRSGNFLVGYRGSAAPGEGRIVEVQISIVPSNEYNSDYTYYCASCKDSFEKKVALNKKPVRLLLSPELHVALDGRVRKISAKKFKKMFGVELLKAPAVVDRRCTQDLQGISNSYRRLGPYIDGRLSYGEGVKSGDLRHVSAKSLLVKALKAYGKKKRLPKVIIVRVNDRVGNGLAAGEYIPQGTIIGEYTGEISKVPPAAQGPDNTYYAPYAPDAVPGSEMFVIDAKKAGNPTRFINHSDGNPNAAWAPVFDGEKFRMIIAATKPIPKGKQILLRYRQSYWLGSPDPLPLE